MTVKKNKFQVVRDHASYIYFKLAWQKKFSMLQSNHGEWQWRHSNRRSPVMETSAMVEFGQMTLAGAALKFRSWQSSLQVRKETLFLSRMRVNHETIVKWSFNFLSAVKTWKLETKFSHSFKETMCMCNVFVKTVYGICNIIIYDDR